MYMYKTIHFVYHFREWMLFALYDKVRVTLSILLTRYLPRKFISCTCFVCNNIRCCHLVVSWWKEWRIFAPFLKPRPRLQIEWDFFFSHMTNKEQIFTHPGRCLKNRSGKTTKMDAATYASLLRIITSFLCLKVALSFNIDVKYPVIKQGPSGSFFGFAVAEHQFTNADSGVEQWWAKTFFSIMQCHSASSFRLIIHWKLNLELRFRIMHYASNILAAQN